MPPSPMCLDGLLWLTGNSPAGPARRYRLAQLDDYGRLRFATLAHLQHAWLEIAGLCCGAPA
jgi:hypothetical protein